MDRATRQIYIGDHGFSRAGNLIKSYTLISVFATPLETIRLYSPFKQHVPFYYIHFAF